MKNIVSRRNFMKLLGSTSVLSALSIFPVQNIFANTRSVSKETQILLGTMVTVVVEDSSLSRREEGLSLAFTHIKELETQLSRYNRSSSLYKLNREGMLKNPPNSLSFLIAEAQKHEEKSFGAFNITIAPVLDYFKRQNHKNDFASEEYTNALSRVNSAHLISVKDNMIAFEKNSTNITLDAIAKGYIVDSVSDMLLALGVERYYVNAGGDIRVGGIDTKDAFWSVAVQSPFNPKNVMTTFSLSDGAVATSGIYEQFYSKDKTINHLITPKNGRSSSIISVTVKAPTAMLADVLATTLSVMSVKEALQYVTNYDKVACLIVEDSKLYKSILWDKT